MVTGLQVTAAQVVTGLQVLTAQVVTGLQVLTTQVVTGLQVTATQVVRGLQVTTAQVVTGRQVRRMPASAVLSIRPTRPKATHATTIQRFIGIPPLLENQHLQQTMQPSTVGQTLPNSRILKGIYFPIAAGYKGGKNLHSQRGSKQLLEILLRDLAGFRTFPSTVPFVQPNDTLHVISYHACKGCQEGETEKMWVSGS